MNTLTKSDNLVEELKSLIATTKEKVTLSVNVSLTLMYWHVGFKINEDILKNSRAEYGKEIISLISQQLTKDFGRGYSKRNIADMIKFSQVFSDVQILQTLSAKLSWSHFKEIIYMDDALKIEFYSQMSSMDNWSVRTLRNRIDSMLYERTALSKKPDELISYELDKLQEGVVTPNMLLKDRYLEKDLEDAILRDIENFLLELGNGFSFITRQKRLQIGEDKLDKSDIHIAKYMTVLPPKEEFEQKLHKVVANAKLKYQK